MSSISIVGSSGSIGTQAADVVRDHPDRFQITAIGARASIETLLAQAREFSPRIVAVADSARAKELAGDLPSGIELRAGPDALESIAVEADTVVNAVVGFAGLPVTLAALQSGRRLALANKESLIAAGDLVGRALATSEAELLPVDSEHGALHQCLRSEVGGGVGDRSKVQRLILTASGGPFRGRSAAELANVSVEEALNHPTWKMGPKITIDSSTLFNKGLEVIEAHVLFGIDYDRIEVVVHPQSILHSAVEFTDGSTIGQMSVPDMRLPIGYAMGHPSRLTTQYGRIDWTRLGALTFTSPDVDVFRCLSLAYAAGRAGGTAPTWLNAANEVAVDAFLQNRIGWSSISEVIEATLNSSDGTDQADVEVVLEADRRARQRAQLVIEEKAR